MVAIHLAAALKARTPGESMGLLAELFDLSGLIFSGIYDIHVPFCIFLHKGVGEFYRIGCRENLVETPMFGSFPKITWISISCNMCPWIPLLPVLFRELLKMAQDGVIVIPVSSLRGWICQAICASTCDLEPPCFHHVLPSGKLTVGPCWTVFFMTNLFFWWKLTSQTQARWLPGSMLIYQRVRWSFIASLVAM